MKGEDSLMTGIIVCGVTCFFTGIALCMLVMSCMQIKRINDYEEEIKRLRKELEVRKSE